MLKLFSVLAVAGLTVAQSIGDSVPACAAPCLTSAVTSATSCSVTDAACQCTVENYRAIYTAALTCVLNGCGADVSLGEVLPAAENFCLEAVGPISAPPVSEGAATTAPAPTTPAPPQPPPATAPAPTTEATTTSPAGSSFATPEGSLTSQEPTPVSASSAAVAEFSGAANPTTVGSWLAIGMALVAIGV